MSIVYIIEYTKYLTKIDLIDTPKPQKNITLCKIMPSYEVKTNISYLLVNLCATKFVAGVNLRRHDTSPDPNCDVCAPEFVAGVNLRIHDTLMRTAMNVMTIFC